MTSSSSSPSLLPPPSTSSSSLRPRSSSSSSSSASSTASDLVSKSLFADPEDFYPPPKPFTFTSYTLRNGQVLDLRLVGQSSLWGHLLWNAGRVAADYLQENAARLVEGKDVLEFGAGAGLPGLVAAACGARSVSLTDYPDSSLIENLAYNAAHALQSPPPSSSPPPIPPIPPITATGYKWGPDPLPPPLTHRTFPLVILADLLFNHAAHASLAASLALALARTPQARALVFFTPYRPWLLERDLAFFGELRKYNKNKNKSKDKDKEEEEEEEEGAAADPSFVVEDLGPVEMEEVMFVEDRGDERLRRTVFRFLVRWSEEELRARAGEGGRSP